MKTHPVGVELFHADRWKDRQMCNWTDKHRQTVTLKLMFNFCTAFWTQLKS